jgi:hypothetical protein
MRAAFVAEHGKLDDEHCPGRHLVGSKLDELTDFDPQVEDLTEVNEKDEGEEDIPIPFMAPSGQVKIKKGVLIRGSAPTDGEELRTKYTLICNAWLMARTRYTSREFIRSLDRNSYDELAKHILGPKVRGLKSAPFDDGTMISPKWSTIMTYQHYVRKKAYELVRDNNVELVTALTSAMAHEETRSLYLTAPFTQEIAKQAKLQDQMSASHKQQGGKGSDWIPPWLRPPAQSLSSKPKGRGKGQPQQKGKSNKGGSKKGDKIRGQPQSEPGADGLFSRTAKGEEICNRYNSADGCPSLPKDCNRHHICRKCRQTGHHMLSRNCQKA